MLLSEPAALISDLMVTNVIYVDTHTDREIAARMFQKYGFLSLPVVDTEERLVGMITIDDALQVISKETSEDISIMAGVRPNDKSYLKTGVFRIWLQRLPWLLVLMLSTSFAGLIISTYENTLAVSIALTASIPMLMGTAGNAGNQSSVTVVRSIALNEIKFSDLFKAVWKELQTSLLLGGTLTLVCFAKLLLVDGLYKIDHGYAIAAVICITLWITIFIAKVIGCSLPLLAKKIRIDPAVMASAVITTVVDVVALIIYCNIAIVILRPIGLL